jgi:hypothetical protein
MQKYYTIGKKEFVLDQAKAEAAFDAKRVINGRESVTFNLLPLQGDEGQPLGARGHPDAEGRRAMALR